MGFKEVKARAIACLKNGGYDHAVKSDIDIKNLFSTGTVDEEYVISLISRTSGEQYSCSPHHQDKMTPVQIFRPFKDNRCWYVKFYFIEPDIIFISVHH